MMIDVDGKKYKLVKDYKDAFNEEEFLSKFTDYFYDYDYIVGDISYGKLRLKGFNLKSSSGFNSINDYSKLEKYLKENCSYDCKYFILKKENV